MKKILVTFILSMYAVILFAAPQAVQVESSISGYMTTDGTVLAGGTVEFFTSDSLSTEKDVYLDAQKVDVIAQPITLNDSGQPISGGTNPIVIFADGTYWVRLTKSDGVVVNTPLSLTYGNASGSGTSSTEIDIATVYGTTDTAIGNAISDYTGGVQVTFVFDGTEFTNTTTRTFFDNMKVSIRNGGYITNTATTLTFGSAVLEFLNQGYIAGAGNLTIGGTILAPPTSNIFQLTGTATISKSQSVSADWWGDTVDNIQDACGAAAEYSKIILTDDDYSINTAIAMKSNQTLEGLGGKPKLTLKASASIASTNGVITLTSDDKVTIRNLWIDGNYANQTTGLIIQGIKITTSEDTLIENCFVENFVDSTNQSAGIQINTSRGIHGTDLRISTCNNNIIVQNASSHNVFENLELTNTIDSEAISCFADQAVGGFNTFSNVTFRNVRQCYLVQRSYGNTLTNFTASNSGAIAIRTPGNTVSNGTIVFGDNTATLGSNGIAILYDSAIDITPPLESDLDRWTNFSNISIDVNGIDKVAVNVAAQTNPPRNAVFSNITVYDSTLSETTSANGFSIGPVENIKFINCVARGIGGSGFNFVASQEAKGVDLINCTSELNRQHGLLANASSWVGGNIIGGYYKNNGRTSTLNYTGISINSTGNYGINIDPNVWAYDDRDGYTQQTGGISVGPYTGTLIDGATPPTRGFWRKGQVARRRNAASTLAPGWVITNRMDTTANAQAVTTVNISLTVTSNLTADDPCGYFITDGTIEWNTIDAVTDTGVSLNTAITTTVESDARFWSWHWEKDGILGISQASAIAVITDASGGSSTSTVNVVSGSGDDATINNNNATILNRLNGVINELKAVGIMSN